MTPILKPLEKHRDYLTIISGLRNRPAESPEPHAYIERTWLSCVSAANAGVASPDAGVTADQFAARHIGQETRLPSLELCTALRGAQVAWRTPKQSLPQEGNPRAVFYRLFGQGDTDAERQAITTETGSLLDRVSEDANALVDALGRRGSRRGQRLSRLGAGDRAPRADDRDARHLGAGDSRCADRRAERHRRAHEADVRSRWGSRSRRI